MNYPEMFPPNLAKLGLARRGDGIDADLATIWATPYPVLIPFEKMCHELGWNPYGGGTREKQGRRIPGYITSGYRDKIIEGRLHSPHMYAFALDIIAGAVEQQITASKIAAKYFNRIGLYPDNGFIHVDQAPSIWIGKYSNRRFWVRKNGVYQSFVGLDEAIKFAGGKNDT